MEAENLEERKIRAMQGDQVEGMSVGPREQLQQKLAVIEMRARDMAQRHGRLATGIAIGAATVLGVGMLIYRRRQKSSMMKRTRRAIPDSVWEMPEELLAQIKKPLQRAAKAL
jgi:hypothetical protein